MSTRAIIITHLPGQPYRSIYSHSDGYPDWLGRALRAYFNDPAKAAALIDLGDISGIADDGSVSAYYRDRGEPWHEVQPAEFSTMTETLDYCDQFDRFYLLDITDDFPGWQYCRRQNDNTVAWQPLDHVIDTLESPDFADRFPPYLRLLPSPSPHT